MNPNHRENFPSFKSEYGAFVGDILFSIAKTCDVNEVNAIDYMVAIQKDFRGIPLQMPMARTPRE